MNQLKKCLFLLAVALAHFQTVQAQVTDIRVGYRLLLTGDTVRGFVNDRGGRRNSLECHFQATRNGATEVFAPQQLAGYGFLDALPKHYQALAAPMPTVPPTAPPLFMDAVTRGIASLYYRADENARAHYYLQAAPGAALEELRVDSRRVEQGGRTYTQTLNYYRQTLELAFRDCPAMQAEIARTAFSLPALTALVVHYNQCRASQTGSLPAVAAPPRQSERAMFSLLVGARIASKLKVANEQGLIGYNQQITQAITPYVGLQLLFNNSRFSRSLWFNLGVGADYQSFSSASTSTVTTAVQTQVTVHTSTTYEALVLRLPLLLRLARPQGVFRPYVEVGAGLNFSIEQKNSIAIIGYGPSGEQSWLGSTPFFQPCFIGSAGFYMERPGRHQLGVALRYENGRGPSNLVTTTTTVSGGQVLLTYSLSK
jgi:hypothetical protein